MTKKNKNLVNRGEFIKALRDQLKSRLDYLEQQLKLIEYTERNKGVLSKSLEVDITKELSLDGIEFEVDFLVRYIKEVDMLVERNDYSIQNVMGYETDILLGDMRGIKTRHLKKMIKEFDTKKEYPNLEELIKEQEYRLTELGYRVNDKNSSEPKETISYIKELMQVVELQRYELVDYLARDKYISEIIEDYELKKEQVEGKQKTKLHEETYESILDIVGKY